MINIEAKRLSGVDRGKHASFSLTNPERHFAGKLWSVEQTGTYETKIKLRKDGRIFGATLQEDHLVNIQGIEATK